LALRVAHLYPKLMNIYGDRGNILCLQHRSEARGISFEVEGLELGDPLKAKEYDLIFVGGAQDREQRLVAEDLVKVKAKPLGDGGQPLGRVVAGFGNNGEDGSEGAVYRNVFGTYLHGALLPKNPKLADHVIETALRRRHKDLRLSEIDDAVEDAAHAAAVRQA